VLAVLQTVRQVYLALDAIASAPAGVDAAAFLAEIRDRVFELLILDRLAAAYPHVHAVLRAVGMIRNQWVPESAGRPPHIHATLHLAALGDVIAHPAHVPQQVFGWGSPDFDLHVAAEPILQLLSGMRLPVQLLPLPPELRAGYADPAAPPSRVPQWMLKVPLLRTMIAGVKLEAGVAIVELPGHDGQLPGLILQPLIPASVTGEFDLAKGLRAQLRAGSDLAQTFGIVVRPGEISVRYPLAPGTTPPSGGFGASLAWTPEERVVWLGSPTRTRLQIQGATIGVQVNDHAGDLELRLDGGTQGLELVLSMRDLDGFLGHALGGADTAVRLPIEAHWSSKTGLSFSGGADFHLSLAPHISLGPLDLRELELRLAAAQSGPPAINADVTAGLSGNLGPFAFAVEQIGLRLVVGLHAGNAGPLDLGAGFKPPSGLGLAVDAGVVKGGGFLLFDPDKGEYAGVLELSLKDIVQIKAIGVLTTRMPDGSAGFSLILIVTGEFPPIQLGFGFTLNGVGGIAGVNRTMAVEPLRVGIRNHTLDSILFPQNPVENAARIISDLRTVFPPAEGRYMFGPMLEIGWGTPTLITASLGVILELPDPVRIAILGQIRALIPSEDAAIVRLHMDVLGVLDFGQKTLAIDATIYDSSILVYALSGDMALRLNWGDAASFAVSVGGLHPRFQPPPAFPSLRRLTLSLGSGDNPRLSCESYMAVTSNSVQFGSHVELYAEAAGFGVHGFLGFDVLIILSPFSFEADMEAGVDLLAGGDTIMSIHLAFTLSGPNPWRARGSASFKVLFVRISVDFDISWGDDHQATLPPVDVRDPLLKALADARNWAAALPAGAEQAVSLAATRAEQTVIVVHPLGRLSVREKVVPLDVTITRFGSGPPDHWDTFAIERVRVNGLDSQRTTLSERFAPGQFFTLPDEDKLSKPAFEPMDAGVGIGLDNAAHGHDSPLELHYETIVIDDPVLPARRLRVFRPDAAVFAAHIGAGAAWQSAVLKTGEAKYVRAGEAGGIAVDDVRHVIASTDDLSVRADLLAASGGTRVAADLALRAHLDRHPEDAGLLQVVPAHEAAQA